MKTKLVISDACLQDITEDILNTHGNIVVISPAFRLTKTIAKNICNTINPLKVTKTTTEQIIETTKSKIYFKAIGNGDCIRGVRGCSIFINIFDQIDRDVLSYVLSNSMHVFNLYTEPGRTFNDINDKFFNWIRGMHD